MSGPRSKGVKPLSKTEVSWLDDLTLNLHDVIAYVNIWHNDVFFGPFVREDARVIMEWLENRRNDSTVDPFDDWREIWQDGLHNLASTTPDDRLASLGYVLRSRAWAIDDLDALYLADLTE